MRIRDMTSEDILPCARIALDSPLKSVYNFTETRWSEQLSTALGDPHNILYVAEEARETGQSIGGFAWVHPRGAFLVAPYLRFIAVGSHAQGQGVGGLLLEEFEKRTFPVQRDYFLLVSDFNTSAQRFYEHHGYRIVGKLENFVIPGVAEIIMSKKRTGIKA